MLDHLKELTDGIVNRTLKDGEQFVAYKQIHGELQKLSPEEFEASKRSEFLLARGAFDRLVHPNRHQTINGSMVIAAAEKLRPVLDHYVGPPPAPAGSVNYTHTGDLVMSDKISIGGDVTGSAVGSHAKVKARDITAYKQVVQSMGDADLGQKLVEAREELEKLPLSPDDKNDTADNLGKLTEELQKEKPEPGRVQRFFGYIRDVAPSVASVLQSAVAIGKMLSGTP